MKYFFTACPTRWPDDLKRTSAVLSQHNLQTKQQPRHVDEQAVVMHDCVPQTVVFMRHTAY